MHDGFNQIDNAHDRIELHSSLHLYSAINKQNLSEHVIYDV